MEQQELKAGSFYLARNNTLHYVAAIFTESTYEYPLGFAAVYQIKANCAHAQALSRPWTITAKSPAVHYHRFGGYDPIEQPEHALDLVQEVFL